MRRPRDSGFSWPDFPTSVNFSFPPTEISMTRTLALAASLLLAGPALAADITVMSGGAVKSAFTESAKAWERKTGNKVDAAFAPAGDLRKKIAAGESADVLIVPRENLPEF